MSRRFFLETPIVADLVQISGSSAHHMINVIRVATGDEVVLFDGSGYEFQATIEDVRKSSLTARVNKSVSVSREISADVTIAVALPKGDRQKILVEKLAEIGVSRLIPINAKRSVAKADAKTTKKLALRVIEASKQCGRNRLMEIVEPRTSKELFANPITTESNGPAIRLLAHPYGISRTASDLVRELKPDESVAIAIGPEGGFDLAEVEVAISAGWQSVSLGPTILRVETAAVVAAILFGLARE